MPICDGIIIAICLKNIGIPWYCCSHHPTRGHTHTQRSDINGGKGQGLLLLPHYIIKQPFLNIRYGLGTYKCKCVCVRACVRECVCACMCACVSQYSMVYRIIFRNINAASECLEQELANTKGPSSFLEHSFDQKHFKSNMIYMCDIAEGDLPTCLSVCLPVCLPVCLSFSFSLSLSLGVFDGFFSSLHFVLKFQLNNS